MKHDVFLCYDKADEDVCREICKVFEENNMKCWMKSRDFSSQESFDKITGAIEESGCVVLLYSKNSRFTNYVITEVDVAFDRRIPILPLIIDGSGKKGKLEFFFDDDDWLSLFPNPAQQLDKLFKMASQITEKPAGDVKLSSKSARFFKHLEPHYKLKTAVKIAIPVVIAIALIYFFVIVPSGQHTTDDGAFSMKVTDVDVKEANGRYFYTVYGESYNLPSNSSKYIMRVGFYDKLNNEVYFINATADEFSSGVICHMYLADDNVTNVTFELVDLNENLLSKQYYEVK